MKAPSPLLGFNNNVRHKGRVFHIQTEDSGIRHPHVITHLFADGGRILKTTKTSYAEHIGRDRLAETVRAMMQEQHKAMFIALRDGQFDYLFDEAAIVANKAAPKAAPDAAATAALRAPEVVVKVNDAPAPKAPEIADAAARAPVVVVAPTPPPKAAVDPGRVMRRPDVAGIAAPLAPTEPAQAAARYPQPQPPPPATDDAASIPPSRRARAARPKLDVDAGAIHGAPSQPSDPSIDLDLDALERAAAEAQTPFFQQIQDLPPPPAAVLGNKRASTGGYSVRSAPPPPIVPTRSAATPPARPPIPVEPSGSLPGRYAPSRPASIFATTRPQEGASIFGEDLISEKSLDEVILSYLAEDLDGPAEKK